MRLHPGARAALMRLGSNELGVARMMAAGELTSPQKYMNLTLYAIRITGTGVSYRPSLDEFVYRRPELYLTEDFLARCSGLPVIWVHPEKSLLDSDEFANRVVGTVMLPYIKDDEVWAIARIYDEWACQQLAETKQSTSPAVLLGPSKKYKGENGEQIIDEGDSTLLDHVAIVTRGVWDKGGDASGVDSDSVRGDSTVTDQIKEVEKTGEEGTKKDAEGEGFKKVMDALGSLNKRMDSMSSRMDARDEEKKKADAARKDAEDEKKKEDERRDAKRKDEEGDEPNKIVEGAQNGQLKSDASEEEKEEAAKRLAADKARKDEEDEEKKKADAARADAFAELRADNAKMAEQIKMLAGRIPKDVDDKEYHDLVSHQSRADDVFAMFGERAPRPLAAETGTLYRRRLATMLQKHSPRWKDIDLADFKADGAFAQIEGQIYADALEAGKRPTGPTGAMREVVKRLDSGHIETTFHGNDVHFAAQLPFSRPPRRAQGIYRGD